MTKRGRAPGATKAAAIAAVTGQPVSDDPLKLQVAAELERRRRVSNADAARAGRDVEKIRTYVGDPWKYFRDAYGWTLTQHMEDALQVIERESRVLLRGGNALGKCLSQDSLVTLADGRRILAASCVGTSQRVLTFGLSGELRAVTADFRWNCVEPLIELTTESGIVVRRSSNHPLWSQLKYGDESCWREISTLQTEDRVAIVEALYPFRVTNAPDAAWRRSGARSGTHWEMVRKVRHLPSEMTVAITVPDGGTFCTELFEHNTEFLAGYGGYRFDAVASVANPDERLDEQGCFLLLLGPDHQTIFGTAYSALLRMRRRAAQHGFVWPGTPSDRSVLYQVRVEDWRVEAFSPPREGDDSDRIMKSSASGRHHLNQVGLVEEAYGLTESLLAAGEGMCSTMGNKMICAFNPDIPTGPIYTREVKKAYVVVEWDAFTHPNVVQRTYVIPGAIDYKEVDRAVRVDARDRGPRDRVDPDDTYGDFTYALPPSDGDDVSERGSRADGVLGHPDGEVHVFRPTSKFSAQRRGKWPRSSDERLFDPGAFDEAVARYNDREDLPECTPVAVGVDPAGQGADEPYACPRWGDDAMTLLLRYAACNGNAAQIAELRASSRATTGHLVALKKGDGHALAGQLCERWPLAAFHVDEGTPSTLSAARNTFGLNAAGVSFGAKSPYRVVNKKEVPILIPGLRYCENLRTWLYVTAAELLRVGLVDLPFDLGLREDLMAHEVTYTRGLLIEMSDPVRGRVRERKPAVILLPKDEVKKRINRSPDKADAWVLSLFSVLSITYDYQAVSERGVCALRNDGSRDFDDEDGAVEAGATFGRAGRFGAGGW